MAGPELLEISFPDLCYTYEGRERGMRDREYRYG